MNEVSIDVREFIELVRENERLKQTLIKIKNSCKEAIHKIIDEAHKLDKSSKEELIKIYDNNNKMQKLEDILIFTWDIERLKLEYFGILDEEEITDQLVQEANLKIEKLLRVKEE